MLAASPNCNVMGLGWPPCDIRPPVFITNLQDSAEILTAERLSGYGPLQGTCVHIVCLCSYHNKWTSMMKSSMDWNYRMSMIVITSGTRTERSNCDATGIRVGSILIRTPCGRLMFIHNIYTLAGCSRDI